MAGFYFVQNAICPVLKNSIGGTPGVLVSCAVQTFYVVFLVPLLFRLIEGKTAVEEATAGEAARG